MEESRGVELDKLHVAHGALGAVDHGYAVAGGHEGVGGGGVDSTHASGGHDSGPGEEGVDAPLGLVEDIGAVAGDVGVRRVTIRPRWCWVMISMAK